MAKFRKITHEHARRICKDVQLFYMDHPVDSYPEPYLTPEVWRNLGETSPVSGYFAVLFREWYIEIDDDKPEYGDEM